MIHHQDERTTPDGVRVFWQEWKPEHTQIKGVVVLVHGLGEHGGRYEHVAEAMTDAGYALLTFDQRGHGRTGGTRGDVLMSEICSDTDIFLNDAIARYAGMPVFLYGHSLGGALVLYHCLYNRPNIKGVIATAPGLAPEEGVSKLTIALVKILARVLPRTQIDNGLDRSKLSRDPAVIEAYNNDELVHGKITVRTGFGLLSIGRQVREKTEFPFPLLLSVGGHDKLIDPKVVQAYGESLKGDVTVKVWDGLYHEIHNEPEQAEVIGHMIDWMNQTARQN